VTQEEEGVLVCDMVPGSTGLKVSEVCLGVMTFGRETGENGAGEMINQFLEARGNFGREILTVIMDRFL